MRHFPPSNRRAAHTLVELVVALPAFAILCVAAASALKVTLQSRALDQSSFQRQYDSAATLQVLTEYLAQAQAFALTSPGTVEFDLPPLDATDTPARAKLAWSGTSRVPNNTLFLTLNGQEAEYLTGQVTNFNLAYQTETLNILPPQQDLSLLARHDTASLRTPQSFSISTTQWCATSFVPTLAVGTANWQLTGIRFRAKRGTGSGNLIIRICATDAAGLPSLPILAEETLASTDLPQVYEWRQVCFSSITELAPAARLAVVWGASSGSGVIAHIEYQTGSTDDTPNLEFVQSANGGGSWGARNNLADIRLFVYGNYNNYTGNRQILRGVRVTAQIQQTTGSIMYERSVTLHSPPEIP
ncbi:MAG: hypothetical protein SFX18_00355 [Pirellulales bacterium]|nr:hypothetical protein [Pirellulales bacterium]